METKRVFLAPLVSFVSGQSITQTIVFRACVPVQPQHARGRRLRVGHVQ